jgi:hypothetical protein
LLALAPVEFVILKNPSTDLSVEGFFIGFLQVLSVSTPKIDCCKMVTIDNSSV